MDRKLLEKRLLYKSSNRGWKENDILLGSFAKQDISKLSDDQLKIFDVLLDESDVDIFNWINKKTAIPNQFDNQVMHMLQEFRLNWK